MKKFSRPIVVVAIVALSAIASAAQTAGNAASTAQPRIFLFAKDEGAGQLIKRAKQFLGYKVELLGERFHRETYLDTADFQLYQSGQFYRITEFFDGQVRAEFGSGSGKSQANGQVTSVSLPLTEVDAAKAGKLKDRKPAGIQPHASLAPVLAVESRKYSVALKRENKAQFLLHLTAGTFTGLTGKTLAKPFWAIEVEPRGAGPDATSRFVRSLASELRLQEPAASLYREGMEKAVLLRPEEKLITPAHALGGTRGKFLDQFDVPDAVAFTADGRLLAGDTDNSRFKIYSVGDAEIRVRIVGRDGQGPGEFRRNFVMTLPDGRRIYNQVQGIAVSVDGLIYVLDQGNLRIQAFNPDGRPLPDQTIPLNYCPKENPECPDGLAFPARKGEYRSIQGLAIDQEGAVYLSDKGTGRVYRYLPGGKRDPTFQFQAFEGNPPKPILREPESLAIYRDKLFVADERNGNIKIYDRKTGRLLDSFGTERFGGHVEGLAVWRDYLFAVDPNQNRFCVFDLKTEKPEFIRAFAGQFESADGIAVDPAGRFLAIADQGNFRILLYSLPEILDGLRTKEAVGG